MFSVFYNFYTALLHYIFNINSNRNLTFKKLVSTSFNVQEKHRYRFKTVFAGIKKVYLLPIVKFPVIVHHTILVYDVNAYSKQDRLNYLQDLYPGIKNLQFISAEEFLGYKNNSSKLFFLIITLPIQFIIIIIGIFKKDKSGINSILSNLLITCNLVRSVKQLPPFKLILFSAYDTNSAFLNFNLQRMNVTVTTVTSEVPLYKWNKIIITDILHICSEYQLEELKQLPGIKYKTIEIGKPEKYFEVKNLYNAPPLLNFKLGFISTGGWVRNELSNINQGIDIEYFENKILKDLNNILKKYKQIELIIYPHPREVSFFNKQEGDIVEFYKKLLPDINFRVNLSGMRTNNLFNEAYLSICFMTTTIFERLHAKRRSAIIYFKEDIFPGNFSSDYLYFISTEQELDHLIQNTYLS